MLLQIADRIFEKYPQVEIGYLVAQVHITKHDPFVEKLKGGLAAHLCRQGMTATNYVLAPSIEKWRKIYEEDFAVKAKTYRSSVEALLRRIITGKSLWNICNVVDLYNCCSILSLLPMGGYDLSKIQGGVSIRYAREGELFLGLGEREKTLTHPRHVVYADDKNILCWLWNHKDSAETCIDANSKTVLFFIDGFDQSSVHLALQQLAKHLQDIQCNPLTSGILNQRLPSTQIHVR